MDTQIMNEYMKTVSQLLDAQSEAVSVLARQMESQQEQLLRLEQQYRDIVESPEFQVHRVPAIDRARMDYEIECSLTDQVDTLNREPRQRMLTISLTSFPRRVYELKYSLFSLTRQTLKPDRIVLWLAHEEFPHREKDIAPSLLALIEKWHITLRWTKNERSYKKLIPTLQAYPEDIIVTADDDLYYSENWLELLYRQYDEFGNVTAHRVNSVLLDDNGCIAPTDTWPYAEKGSLAYSNEGTTGGGVLFFPGCFHSDVLDAEKYLRLCPTEDQLWLWAMVVLAGQKTRMTTGAKQDTLCVNPFREFSPDPAEHLMAENIFRGGTDRQMQQLISEYPQIVEILREEAEQRREGAAW